MQIIDSISLWVGRFFVWSAIFFIIGIGIFLSWKFVLEPISITFKHLFPPFHFKRNLIDEWVEIIANADKDDWRSQAKLYVKGRFFLMYWGHQKNPLAKFEMGLIKKE